MFGIALERRQQLDLRVVVEAMLSEGATIVNRDEMIIEILPCQRKQLIVLSSGAIAAIDAGGQK